MAKQKDIALALALLALYVLAVKWIWSPALSAVEIAGVAANIAAIILLKRESPWGFGVGIAANATLAAYFIIIGLSGQAINRVLYAIMSAASLISWLLPNKKTGKPLRPSFLPVHARALILAGLAAVVAAKVVAGAGTVGILDYSSLYLSLAAGLLIIRKKAECWYFWLAMDAVNLPLFVMAGAYVNIFYGAFSLVNDSLAAARWTREIRKKKP
jgi:nicotinamide riboside transporter PnuC